MSPVRVLLADDEGTTRRAWRLLIDSDPDMTVVAEADDGVEAVRLAKLHRPDVALIDIRMPLMTGLDATRRLCADSDGPRVIVLTAFEIDEYVYEALAAGASAFLPKGSLPRDMLQAIRVVHAGDALLTPHATTRLIRRLTLRVTRDPRLRQLSPRERKTFDLIARGASNDEIAETLVVPTHTVRSDIGRILTTLGARDRAQLITIAYASGAIGRL